MPQRSVIEATALVIRITKASTARVVHDEFRVACMLAVCINRRMVQVIILWIGKDVAISCLPIALKDRSSRIS